MPDPTNQDPNQPLAPGTPPASPPPVGDPPPQRGNNVMIPKTAFDARVKQAKQSGRTAYQAELDAQAQAKGFANHAAMMAHVDTILTRTPVRTPAAKPQGQAPGAAPSASGTPPAPPKNRNDRQAMDRYQRDLQNWQRKAQASEQTAEVERKKRRKAERERDALEARSNLERIANRCGVKDTDYAIHLYTQHCQGKTEEELSKMDEEAFFNGLRKNHAYIFGETVVPATTGTSGAVPGSHAPPSAAATGAAAGAAGSVDVSKMDKATYRNWKATQGWSKPIANGGRAS